MRLSVLLQLHQVTALFSRKEGVETSKDAPPFLLAFVRPYGSSYEGAIQKLTDQYGTAVHETNTPMEAFALTRRAGGAGVVVLHCQSELDLERLILLQRVVKQANHPLKLIITSSIKDPASNFRLSSLTGAEVLPEPVSEKSLLFKVDRMIKTLPKAGPGKAANAAPASGKESEEIVIAAGPVIRQVKPLDLDSDCWAQVPDGIRHVAGRWAIRLMGPPPTSGQWERFEQGDGEAWAWTPSDTDNKPYVREEGAWVFFGQRPDWLTERRVSSWVFVSQNPRLSYYIEGKSYGAKFVLGAQGALEVAADSVTAQQLVGQTRPAHAVNASGANTSRESATSGADNNGMMMGEGAFRGPQWKIAPPLELDSDCWVQSQAAPARANQRWTVSFVGPPPEFGQWDKMSGTDNDNSVWRWTPKDPPNDPFIVEEGAWQYRGYPPRFHNNVWHFVGKAPELAFYYNGENYGSKLRVDAQGVLYAAADSEAGRKHFERIERQMERLVPMKGTSMTAKPTPKQEDEERAERVFTTKVPGAEGRDEAIKREESAPAVPMHEMAEAQFGEGNAAEKGKWACATPAYRQRRWFVLIPRALDVDRGIDVRKISEFWTYFGPEAPERTGHGTVRFQVRAPQKVSDFADLPKKVKDFLLEYFPASPEAAEASFWIEQAKFGGAQGGEWEAASFDAQHRHWYVFIPPEAKAEKPADIRKLAEYWVYFGPGAPKTTIQKGLPGFEFRERAAVRFTGYRDLPKAVQEFLRKYFVSASELTKKSDLGRLAIGENEVVWIDAKLLGPNGGEWEKVADGTEGRHWYLFVKTDWIAHDSDQSGPLKIREAGPYWSYFGTMPPIMGKGEHRGHWGFKGREPHTTARFGELDREIQLVLSNMFPDFSAEARAEADAAEARDFELNLGADETKPDYVDTSGKNERTLERDFHEKRSAAIGEEKNYHDKPGAPKGDGKDFHEKPAKVGEVKDFVEKRDDEIAAKEFRDQTAAAPQAAAKAKKDAVKAAERAEMGNALELRNDRPDDQVIPLDPSEKKKVYRRKDGRDEAVSDAESGSTEVEGEKNAATAGAQGEQRAAKEAKPAPAATGPKAIVAERASEPALSPLALAMLMSELVSKRDLDRKRIGIRYCQYLSASLGNLRIELWSKAQSAGGSWFCIGASDGGDGSLGDVIAGLVGDGAYGMRPGDVLFVPIHPWSAAGAKAKAPLVGALLVSGGDVREVKEVYATAAAQVSTGLVEGMAKAA